MGYFIHQLFSLNIIFQRDRKHVCFPSAARTIRSTAEHFALDLPHNSAVLVAFAHRSFLCFLLPAGAVASAPQHPTTFLYCPSRCRNSRLHCLLSGILPSTSTPFKRCKCSSKKQPSLSNPRPEPTSETEDQVSCQYRCVSKTC